MLLPYTTAEWWYLGAGGVPVVKALRHKSLEDVKPYFPLCFWICFKLPYRHQEQSFTSNRSKSLSMFFLMGGTQQYYSLRGAKLLTYWGVELTHYLLQTRRWHLCMPQLCVCCACIKNTQDSEVITMKNMYNLKASFLLGEVYLAPTNSSHGGSLLHRWTVSNGPKLSVRYSTLSEQLWSKSTLGATFVDLQDIFRFSPTHPTGSVLIYMQGHRLLASFF